MRNFYKLSFFILFVAACQKQNTTSNPILKYVNPFIGTGGHGHTYPGATSPFGMIQLSPDNGTQGWDWCSAYHVSDSILIGFSHLHLSGTGIGDLADIRLMPLSEKIVLYEKPPKHRDSLNYKSSFKHENETAKAGYYSVFLEKGKIKVGLTTSEKVGYHKYTYSEKKQQSVVLDLGFTFNWDKTTQTHIQKKDAYTVVGHRFSTGWAKNQKVYFVVKFSKPIISAQINKEQSLAQFFLKEENSNILEAKVAISSVSIENAFLNLHSDGEKEFDTALLENKKKWEHQLKTIEITTADDNLKTCFYTALYHTQIAPVLFNDANGAFRRGDDTILKNTQPQYSTLSLWDTFRALHPLLTIINPKKVGDIIQSMLLYYQEKNTVPVWTLYGNETNCMTGYHSIPVIVEAYLKGIRNFDIEKAYLAIKNTMMGEERGLKAYKKYGYIPWNILDESVTITLEYAYDDWCVAQMAKALGKKEDYVYFLNRSKAYKHLFDKKTGFMRGKHTDGKSWHIPFDPKYSAHRVHADYTEGNAWQHSWFVPHNVENLINLYGGKENFNKKLEQLFSETSEITGENISADISGLIGQYAHGNEPSHHIAYLFNKARKPWRTQYWTREILKTQYKNAPDGLSGNEDCGQMSAWYVLSAMGLYAMNPAAAEYEITSPLFEKTKIHLKNGKVFIIIAKNTSDKNKYIQSATLNGKNFNKTTISHQTLMNGGILEFVMGSKPNKKWGIQNP